MLYKTYGKTGIKLSRLGFGGMRFKAEDIESKNYAKCADIMLLARDLGINYFDTAATYNNGASEEIFGVAFSQMKRENFYVSTKNGLLTGDKTKDDFRRRLETSLTRMKVDKIDFYHMWCIRTYDSFLAHLDAGFYDFMQQAKSEGLIGHAVFSTHDESENIEKMLDHNLFDGVLLGFNAANAPYRQQALKDCKKRNLGVVTMNPLSGGVIPKSNNFEFLKENPDQTIAQAALRFNAKFDEVTVVLSGMSSEVEVRENCAAFEEDIIPYTDTEKKEVLEKLSTGLSDLCTMCGYCMPCPAGIPISKLMDCANMAILTRDSNAVKNHHKYMWWLETKGEQCIECGQCEEKCTQKLKIIDKLKDLREQWL